MEEITVTIPRERPFGAVAGLVLGGVAARHDLTLDVLDDLQLALDALLDHVGTDAGDVSIVLRVEAGTVEVGVGPLPGTTASQLQQEAGEGIDLKRLLATVVDSISVRERDGGSWVELRKGYALAGSDS